MLNAAIIFTVNKMAANLFEISSQREKKTSFYDSSLVFLTKPIPDRKNKKPSTP
jgi:hypothetical protein